MFSFLRKAGTCALPAWDLPFGKELFAHQTHKQLWARLPLHGDERNFEYLHQLVRSYRILKLSPFITEKKLRT